SISTTPSRTWCRRTLPLERKPVPATLPSRQAKGRRRRSPRPTAEPNGRLMGEMKSRIETINADNVAIGRRARAGNTYRGGEGKTEPRSEAKPPPADRAVFVVHGRDM